MKEVAAKIPGLGFCHVSDIYNLAHNTLPFIVLVCICRTYLQLHKDLLHTLWYFAFVEHVSIYEAHSPTCGVCFIMN